MAQTSEKKKFDWRKYKGASMTILQTVAMAFIAIVVTILQCGFSFKEFNWLNFGLNFMFGNYMKMVYTAYQKQKELQAEDIVTLMNTITMDKKEIYAAKKTKEFEEEIHLTNKINKLDAYITELDSKKKIRPKKVEEHLRLRNWAYDYKKDLENGGDGEEFERVKSIKSIKVAYEEIEPSKLFTYGLNQRYHKRKYTFNAWTATISRAWLPLLFTTAFSIIFGMISNEGYIRSGKVWIDLAGYVFTMAMGAWWGIRNGKAIIQEDYAEVLNNVASLVRDVKAKVLK